MTVQGDIYTPNPVSADFSVDGVIASLEGVGSCEHMDVRRVDAVASATLGDDESEESDHSESDEAKMSCH